MKKKESAWEYTPNCQDDNEVPFGDPPIMYNYSCNACNYSSEMNEAIIDVAYSWAKKGHPAHMAKYLSWNVPVAVV